MPLPSMMEEKKRVLKILMVVDPLFAQVQIIILNLKIPLVTHLLACWTFLILESRE